jgi:hypothetical protein
MTNALLVIVIFVTLIVVILETTGVFTIRDNMKQIQRKSKKCINSTSFKPGYIKNTPQPLADLCNDTMYPIQPPYVNYGSYGKKKCDINVFNSPP